MTTANMYGGISASLPRSSVRQPFGGGSAAGCGTPKPTASLPSGYSRCSVNLARSAGWSSHGSQPRAIAVVLEIEAVDRPAGEAGAELHLFTFRQARRQGQHDVVVVPTGRQR